jgi:putative ATPase
LAIEKAYEDVEKEKTFQVPNHLKNNHYPGAKILKRGEGYKYPHNYSGYVKQKYTPKKVKYYEPKDSGFELKIKKRLEELRR